MKIADITKIVLFVFIVGLLGYDVYAVIAGGTEATISHLVIEMSYQFPAFTFAVGFLMGHLFFKIREVKK